MARKISRSRSSQKFMSNREKVHRPARTMSRRPAIVTFWRSRRSEWSPPAGNSSCNDEAGLTANARAPYLVQGIALLGLVEGLRSVTSGASRFFDLEAFAATPLTSDPFPYLIVPGFLPRAAIEAVVADFPRVEKPGSFPVSELRFGG